jgi:hypothetical protein
MQHKDSAIVTIEEIEEDNIKVFGGLYEKSNDSGGISGESCRICSTN